tara:strand:+ start:867 stop:1343 length:477 start_codon:yes stop_codon:yes gene_type:complete
MKYLIVVLLLFSSSTKAQELYDQYNLNSEELCLVQSIYFEARSESFIGQVAVANVILQRVISKSFPNTICGVVHSGKYWKGNPIKNRCSFSYWCDGKSEKMYDYESYYEAILVSKLVLGGGKLDLIDKATHYHASYVYPNWAPKMKRIIQIGKHIFYK